MALGVATGGASEIGRLAAGTARRSGVPAPIAAGIGYASGSRETGVQTLGAGTGPVSPAQSGGVAAAAGSVQATNQDAQRELDASVTRPSLTTIAAPNPLLDDENSRARARASAQRMGGGRRRASEYMTAPYLGA